jgi:hypothetical protein
MMCVKNREMHFLLISLFDDFEDVFSLKNLKE